MPRISNDELKTKLGSPDVVLLDVRAKNDWERSDENIAGAVRMDPQTVDAWTGTDRILGEDITEYGNSVHRASNAGSHAAEFHRRRHAGDSDSERGSNRQSARGLDIEQAYAALCERRARLTETSVSKTTRLPSPQPSPIRWERVPAGRVRVGCRASRGLHSN